MSLKEFKDRFVKAENEAWYRGNVDALDEVDDPNIVIHMPPNPDLVGREAHKQLILGARQAFSDYQHEWKDFIGEGDIVAVRYIAHMKHTGETPTIPVPPTGKELITTALMMFHLKNDKIVEAWMYPDRLGVLEQLGITLPMGQE